MSLRQMPPWDSELWDTVPTTFLVAAPSTSWRATRSTAARSVAAIAGPTNAPWKAMSDRTAGRMPRDLELSRPQRDDCQWPYPSAVRLAAALLPRGGMVVTMARSTALTDSDVLKTRAMSLSRTTTNGPFRALAAIRLRLALA